MQSIANGTELGAYTIVRLIGRGGMGEVYEAYEHRLQRRVALKVIAPAKAGTHGEVDLVRRFLQEARTLAQINHPNVVTIFSIDRINDTQFIAMEFVDGASFKDLFSMFALSADEAAPIFLQLLEGLRALHENRILHRDIKPHNLMIRPNGQVKILDFGIAKRLNDREREHTTVGVVVGTLSYLPPEVLYGAQATTRSDLWSMGAIFYECLVGQPLVSMSSIKVKGARAAADSDVIFPTDSLGWVPPEMRAIVGKLCDRRPELRYETALQAIEDIKHYQMNRPPMAPGAAKALFQAVDDIEDLKESADLKKLTDGKRKREFTVTVLGGAVQTVVPSLPDVDHDHELDGEAIISEVVRDSVSARRKAQGRASFKKIQWQTPAMIIAAVVLAVGLTAKIMSPKGKDAPVVKPEPAPVAESLHLVSPAANQALWLEPTQLPTLSWSKTVLGGEYELQIATDANFNSIIVREDVSGNSYRPARILTEGEYHWQLWPEHGTNKAVGPGFFTVAFLSPIELTWPKAEQNFNLGRGVKGQSISFKWKCKPGAKTYGAQISNDSSFTSIVQETILGGCAWNDVNLPPGNYFWRVRVEEPVDAQASTSNKQTFVIKGGVPAPQPITPAASVPTVAVSQKIIAPHLKNPKQTVTLRFAKGTNIRDIASARKQLAEVPVFLWQPVRGAKSYSLQISWNAEFTRLLTEENVPSSSYEWRLAVPGKFFWRVRANNDLGNSGPYSAHGTAEVNLQEPVLGSVYTFTEKGSLEWDAVPLAEKYIVETSLDRSMASAAAKQTEEPQIPLELGPQPTYVRIAAANSAGERVSGFSQIATVTFETPLRLAAPGLITPPKGAKVTLPKSGRISIVFSWNPVEHASNYYVEISKYPNFSKTIQKKAVHSNKWVLKGAKFEGKVYWRVRTEGRGGPSPWSHSGFFEVR